MRAAAAALALLAACGAPARSGAPAPAAPSSGTSALYPASGAPSTADEGLGALRFEVTGGTAEARLEFLRGLLALHSFWYEEATRRFDAAVKEDATFVMARWGAALSRAMLLWGNDDLERGRAELAAITDTSRLTPREVGWIDAVRALYASDELPARRAAFVDAMEQLHRTYPDDDEVSLFLSLALLSQVTGEDTPTPVRVRAGALALDVFARNPNHPGAAHYIIHAFDTPELAALALPAARQYAAIAPAAFHARHMPAHIFARFGMWDEAAASCHSAWDASAAWTEQGKLSPGLRDFHSLSWIVFLELERGHRKDAAAAVALFGEHVTNGLGGQRGLYIDVVGMYAGMTEQVDQVEALLRPLDAPRVDDPGTPHGAHAPPWGDFEAMALAQVRLSVAIEKKDVAAVKKALAALDALDAKLDAFREKELGKVMARKQAAEAKVFRALERKLALARARRDAKAALPLIRKLVAEAEKHPQHEPNVMGGSPREGLAQTLTELGKHAEALAEFERLLDRTPRRARLLLGAARAAAKAGDAATSRDYYQQLLDVWKDADPDHPQLDEVRRGAAAP
jgi:tetratricopeptide (TPR) repeat protein